MPASLDVEIYAGDKYQLVLTHCVPGTARVVEDVVTTSTSTTLTSATGAFTAADTGKVIAAGGIPAGTTVTYVSATQLTLSQAATETSSDGTAILGTPVNLTGKTFTAPQVRPSAASTVVLATMTLDQTTYLTTGQLVASLTGAQTQDLASGYWDLPCVTDVATWWAGRVNVTRDVTRA